MLIRNTHSFEDYFTAGEENTRELFEENGSLIRALRDTHTFLTTTLWEEVEGVSPLPATLAMNSFTLWLAGVKLATTGHTAAIFPVLRTALESACYCALMAKDEKLQKIWMERGRDEASWKLCRRSFSSAVADACKLINVIQPESGEWIYEAYQKSIDLGGHPNFRGVFDHISMDEEPDYNIVKLTGLHHAQAHMTKSALVAAIDFGLAIAIVLTRAMDGQGAVLQGALTCLIDGKEAAVAEHFEEPEEEPAD